MLTTLTERPIDTTKYRQIPVSNTPLILLGTVLKHSYDEDRLTFNNDRNIVSIRADKKILRGLPLQPKLSPNNDLLFKQLKIISDKNMSVLFYDKLLRTHGFSCTECMLYLSKGVYPVNGEYINELTTTTDTISSLCNRFFTGEAANWQSMCSLTLFIHFNKS